MPQPRRLPAVLRRFVRAREGATAIEFGIIAIPMLMLIFGTIELGMVLLVSTTLDTATDFASREIRTGRFQGGAQSDASTFKTLLCNQMTWLSQGCTSKVIVEAQTYSNFTTAGQSAGDDPSKFDSTIKRCWSVGNQGDIVVVRTYYAWPLFTPLLNASLANSAKKTRLITSARAFKNEPYGGAAAAGAQCVKQP